MFPIIPAWLATAAVASQAAEPILGALGSLFGAKESKKNVEQTNAMNLQIARENNSAQERMLFYNNAFNKQAAIDMFNLENQYNSPANQRALMLQGGFNPATMYQNGAQVARSDASTPQAASSGITPSTPNLTPPPSVIGSMFGNFETLTRSLSNIANSNLTNAQKDRLTFLLSEEFNNLAADTAWKNAQADMQRLQVRFEKEFGRINRQTDLGLKVSQIWDNFQDACLKATQGDLNEAQKLYVQSMKDLNDIDYKIKEESKEWIVKNAEQTYNNAVKEGKRIDSATNLNNASAAKESAQAAVLRQDERRLVDTYQAFVDEVNAKSGKEVLSYVRDLATQKDQIYQIINASAKTTAEKEAAEHEAERAFQLAELAEKENSSYYARLCINALGTILGAGGIAVGAVKVFGNSKPTKVKGFE